MMPDWMTTELGSLLAFLFLIFLFIDSKRRANIKAELKAETGNKLTQNLIADVADLKLHGVKVDGKLENIRDFLHNGLSEQMNKLIESDGNQWAAISKNKEEIGIIKDRTD